MDDAMTRRADLVADLRKAVFESPGDTSQEERVAAGTGGVLAEPWASYAEKVRDHSYRVTDADIAALKASGCGEEEIFEITIAAAQGAALRRLDAALRASTGRPDHAARRSGARPPAPYAGVRPGSRAGAPPADG